MTFRSAQLKDADLYFTWANDPSVRQFAVNTDQIDYAGHVAWFASKLADPHVLMLLFLEEGVPIGQMRIEIQHIDKSADIDYSLGLEFRGKGKGTGILRSGAEHFFSLFPEFTLYGLVDEENIASLKAFHKSGFLVEATEDLNGRRFKKFRRNA